MNKYYVLAKVVTESWEQIEIEAESETKAKSKTKKLINDGSYTYFSIGTEKKIEIMQINKND